MTGIPDDRLHPVVSSALWAAWGDALGFITELTTSLGEVSRRSGGAKIENTVQWSRRIGGRFGPMVDLPAGTYSDDTQLRLAVSRSIRANGRFDLEAFSKIELPVLLSYEMRAGKGTKAAANELMKRHVRWSGNFFDNDRARYIDAGGNGAAMRIQPHVWSARGYVPKHFLGGVASDAIVTHGHPRGVVGAVIHANALSSVLRHGQVPGPDVWEQVVEYAGAVPDVMSGYDVLRERWLPMWEKAAGRSWRDGVAEAIAEGKAMVAAAQQAAEQTGDAGSYRELLVGLGGKTRETMGSGMVAAVASLFAAWVFRDDPVGGLRVIVNHLGTDTDTIATMTGALLGATGLEPPPGPVLDYDYIAAEAKRMLSIGEGHEATNFPHPDPLKWKPPRTLADAVGTTNEGLFVAGLGPVVKANSEYQLDSNEASIYQWMTLAHGQTVLIKRRKEPSPLPAGALPVERPPRAASSDNGTRQAPLFDDRSSMDSDRPPRPPREGLEAALHRVVESDFDEHVIGEEMLRFAATSQMSFERASDFAVAVTTAYRSKTTRPSRR